MLIAIITLYAIFLAFVVWLRRAWLPDALIPGLLALFTAGFFWRVVSGQNYMPADGGDQLIDQYQASLKNTSDPRIIFTGYVFGEGYWELASNAFAQVLTSGVGGTHPALVEAMAYGNCVIVHNTAENLETIGDACLSYDGEGGGEALRSVLKSIMETPKMTESFRKKAEERASLYYTWEAITDSYEALFYDVLAGQRVASFETAVSTPHQ